MTLYQHPQPLQLIEHQLVSALSVLKDYLPDNIRYYPDEGPSVTYSTGFYAVHEYFLRKEIERLDALHRLNHLQKKYIKDLYTQAYHNIASNIEESIRRQNRLNKSAPPAFFYSRPSKGVSSIFLKQVFNEQVKKNQEPDTNVDYEPLPSWTHNPVLHHVFSALITAVVINILFSFVWIIPLAIGNPLVLPAALALVLMTVIAVAMFEILISPTSLFHSHISPSKPYGEQLNTRRRTTSRRGDYIYADSEEPQEDDAELETQEQQSMLTRLDEVFDAISIHAFASHEQPMSYQSKTETQLAM